MRTPNDRPSIKAKGKYVYDEQVPSKLFSKLHVGDEIEIGVSTFLKIGMSISFGDDKIRLTSLQWLGLGGIIFLMPLLSFARLKNEASDYKWFLVLLLMFEGGGIYLWWSILKNWLKS